MGAALRVSKKSGVLFDLNPDVPFDPLCPILPTQTAEQLSELWLFFVVLV